MIQRKCVICGKPFNCYPSDNKVTCSNACRRERQRRIVKENPVKWGDTAKERLSKKGQTDNLRKGTEAAKRSPIAGRGETNREAKIWVLISPDGREITVRNLRHWARANTELFDKPPGDKSAYQICCGFSAIAQTLKGNRGPNGPMTYFGWSLKDLPVTPGHSSEK